MIALARAIFRVEAASPHCGAAMFYQGAYFTSLEPGETCTAVRNRRWPVVGPRAPFTRLKRNRITLRPRAVDADISAGKGNCSIA